MKTLFLLIIFLISYGSLYPFDFTMVGVKADSLAILFQTWDSYNHRGDILANIALFFPLGLTGVLMLPTYHRTHFGIFIIVFIGFVVGVILQVVQIYLPSRDANLSDAVLNVVGTVIGSYTARALNPKKLPFFNYKEQISSFPILLISSWLAYRLMPFIPTIDWQEIKNSIKPLILNPEWEVIRIFHDCTAWLIVFYFLTRSFQIISYRYLAILIISCFTLEIFIVNNVITISNIVGAVSAFLLWYKIIPRISQPATLLSIATILMLVLSKLTPFELADSPQSFHWIPFHGFLEGSMLSNTSTLFEKFFIFGAIICLLKDCSIRLRSAILITISVTLIIEIAQIYFKDHFSEITDPLLVLLIGFLASAMQITSSVPNYLDKQFQRFSVKIFLNSPDFTQQIQEQTFTSDLFPIYLGRHDEETDQSMIDHHQILLKDREPYQLSRNHFSIDQINHQVVIKDLDSTLGTLVNGKPIGKKSIRKSKKLNLGENEIIAGQPHSDFFFRILVEQE